MTAGKRHWISSGGASGENDIAISLLIGMLPGLVIGTCNGKPGRWLTSISISVTANAWK